MQTLFAVLVMALLGLSGLAIDGGAVFMARRDTQALADAAARAGAGELDEIALRADPENPPQIDPVAAAEAATNYLYDVRPTATIRVLEVDTAQLKVQVTSAPVSVTLLQLAGVGQSVRVAAIGKAQSETGIMEPGQ